MVQNKGDTYFENPPAILSSLAKSPTATMPQNPPRIIAEVIAMTNIGAEEIISMSKIRAKEVIHIRAVLLTKSMDTCSTHSIVNLLDDKVKLDVLPCWQGGKVAPSAS